jgi:uncharacterized membrane protein
MATLTVWKFDTPDGAEKAEHVLRGLQEQELIIVHDAAMVSWEPGRKRPKTHQTNKLTATTAMGGAFWGLLFGLIFFVPFLGLAVGAATGALAGSMADVGIDDNFIKKVRDQVQPGTSALFLLTSDAVEDKVRDAFKGTHMELIQTNLSSEEEARLHEVFSD